MAISKNFFGLRRGSTKAFTYSIQNGMQITKDRVLGGANPQTSAQMLTRISLATVAIAAQRMTDLVGISFAGVSKVTDAKRVFRGENIRRLIAYQKSGDNVYFTAKGMSCLVPNAYLVAKGSLPKCLLQTEIGTDWFRDKNIVVTVDAGQELTAVQIVRLLFGCEPGDQLTSVQIQNGQMVQGYDDTYEWLKDFEMTSQRMVFKSEEDLLALGSINFGADTTAAAVQTALAQMLAQVTVNNKSYESMRNFYLVDFFTVTKEDGVFTITGSPTTVGSGKVSYAEMVGSNVVALGFFRSHLNGQTWNYSNCVLTLVPAVCNAESYNGMYDSNYGLLFDTAMSSYLDSTERESVRYTQAGGPQNSLGSF